MILISREASAFSCIRGLYWRRLSRKREHWFLNENTNCIHMNMLHESDTPSGLIKNQTQATWTFQSDTNMYKFLCLPILATASNLVLAILFLRSTSKVAHGQNIPVQNEYIGADSLVCINADNSCQSSTNAVNVSIEEPIEASQDPNLREMPNGFRACKTTLIKIIWSTFASK